MTEYTAPNPCLLAILLTISTHSGPQFVCHYPPVPDTHDYKAAAPFRMRESELQSDTSSSSSDAMDSSDGLSDDEDDRSTVTSDTTATMRRPTSMHESLLSRLENQRGRRRHPHPHQQHSSPRSTDRSLSKLRKQPSDDTINRGGDSKRGSSAASLSKGSENWQKLLGFDADFLSELLCPPRGMCNTKFEMTIDDMVFLGIPVHIQPDGDWKRAGHKYQHPPQSSTAHPPSHRRTKSAKNSKREKPIDEEKAMEGDDEISDDNFDASEEDTGFEEEDEEETAGDDDGESRGKQHKKKFNDSRSPMRMFHVVFVMNPPATEYNLRIDEMYHYVLNNFVKCLRHEQAKSNYVWREVSTMLQVRDEAAMESLSALQVWEDMQRKSSLAAAISQLYIAVVNSDIANVIINQRLRSFQIPLQTEFQTLPPITTVKPSIAYLTTTGPFLDTPDESAEGLTAHYGILLLEDPETLIRDIRADMMGTLAALIREINPTQSIYQTAQDLGLAPEQIIEVTKNLMYWRRARAIIPIHHRNIYIVSPLAPLSELYKYVPMFEEKFASLPSLPRILAMLSTGKPRNFSAHIPSRDHRRVYLNALAWLLRHGFVTQLKTFLWIRVSKRIKNAVHQDQQMAEEMEDLELNPKQHKKTDTSTDNTSKQQRGNCYSSSPSKPSLLAAFEDSDSNDELGTSVPERDDDDDDEEEDELEESIILDPERATLLQRKWMAKILEDKLPDVERVFNKVKRYFNGNNTMEKAMVLENLTRHDMRKLTSALEEHLFVVRHW